jgi:hypothetical protein
MPKEDINAVGQGSQFRYCASLRPEDISPRSSSPSSDFSGSPPRSLSSEQAESIDTPPKFSLRPSRVVSEGNFTIEEMRDSDMQSDSEDDISVVQPDHYEYAESDMSQGLRPVSNTIDSSTRSLADDLEKLDCNNHDEKREAWLQEQRKLRRRKRLSSGSVHKRTLSQSIGSDTDDEDVQQLDANEAGSSARRLRRKTGDRTSLIFDDPPSMIVELDEPESDHDSARMQVAEPDVDVDVEELGLHSLPYYDYASDSMEVDSNVSD